MIALFGLSLTAIAAIVITGLTAGWGVVLGLFFVWLALSAPASLILLAILAVGGRSDRERD